MRIIQTLYVRAPGLYFPEQLEERTSGNFANGNQRNVFPLLEQFAEMPQITENIFINRI